MQKAGWILDFGMRPITERRVPRTSTITNHIPTGFLYGEFPGGLTGVFGAMRTIAIRFLRGFPAGAEKLFPRGFIRKNRTTFVSHEWSFCRIAKNEDGRKIFKHCQWVFFKQESLARLLGVGQWYHACLAGTTMSNDPLRRAKVCPHRILFY